MNSDEAPQLRITSYAELRIVKRMISSQLEVEVAPYFDVGCDLCDFIS